MKSIFPLLFICALIIFTSTAISQNEGMPDLIITDVTYSLSRPIKTNPSSGVMLATTLFKVTIKNIGDGNFLNQIFYLSLAWTERDINSGHYSTIAGVSSKTIVSPGESFDVEIAGPTLPELKKSDTRVKFLIQTDGKKHLKDPLPKIQEKDYDNNTYEITISS